MLRKLGNICCGHKSVSEQNQKHFLCLQQMLRARANGETLVSATMCPQQCVLICEGLIYSVPSQVVHDAFDCECLLQSTTEPDRYVKVSEKENEVPTEKKF